MIYICFLMIEQFVAELIGHVTNEYVDESDSIIRSCNIYVQTGALVSVSFSMSIYEFDGEL